MASTPAAGQAPDLPADAVALRKLLKSCGVEEYEPRVLAMLLEFMHKYTTDVIQQADAYAEAAERPGRVEADDILLAAQAHAQQSFVSQPPQELLNEVAAMINAKELPKPGDKVYGLRLPKEEHLLTQPGWQVRLPHSSRGGQQAQAAPQAHAQQQPRQ
jgi:transcription initiation factor TFIID subunit 9B